MTSSGAPKQRTTRKLVKKRRDGSSPSATVPERPRKDAIDLDEDVLAPRTANAQFGNQSVFSMIAAVGSKTDFHAHLDDLSDSSDGDHAGPAHGAESPASLGMVAADAALSSDGTLGSGHQISRSLPSRSLRTDSRRRPLAEPVHHVLEYAMGESPAQRSSVDAEPRALPEFRTLDQDRREAVDRVRDAPLKPSTALPMRLKDIFELARPEEVVAEYPCWLLKSVLLQGYMYVTAGHVCFYAYLPRKTNIIIKSGYLSKRGRQNPRYSRYWLTLKGNVLSYYADPSNLYFPSGYIDLTYAISAALVDAKEHGKEATGFCVTTQLRKYHFRADSAASAKEWVKTLQRVVFRSHNDGDSVKILLPLENIMDVEDSPVLEFADTIKIRVVDNDETYAIDEYYFSFFSLGSEALRILRTMGDDAPAKQLSSSLPHSGHERGRVRPGTLTFPRRLSSWSRTRDRSGQDPSNPQAPSTPVLHETVRDTLSPRSPSGSGRSRSSPRPSGDVSRANYELGRRSMDIDDATRRSDSAPMRRWANRRRSLDVERGSLTTRVDDLQDSSVQSLDREADSISVIHSIDDDHPTSPSQILKRSDVFQSPTIQRSSRSSSTDDEAAISLRPPQRRLSDNDRQRLGRDGRAEIRIHPPTRSHTQQGPLPPPPPSSSSSSLPRSNNTVAVVDTDLGGRRRGWAHPHSMTASASSPTLQELVKAGSYPLQRAAGFAGYLKNHSKRMSSLLATESMGYLEKVSGMWVGARRHYHDPPGLHPDGRFDDPDDGDDLDRPGLRFREHFALPDTERLQATYFAYLHRVLPLYGKVYVSDRSVCFRSLLPGTRTKMILPLKHVENVEKEKGFCFGYSGLVVIVHGHEELFFEFAQPETRDDCAVMVLRNLDTVRHLQESGLLNQEEHESANAAKAEHRSLQEVHRGERPNDVTIQSSRSSDTTSPSTDAAPILFDDPRVSFVNFKPTVSLRVTCLTIGSRGDVQPYIALCKGLLAEGHQTKIATHVEFGDWVRSHGIEFAPVDGDPAELMRICVENGIFTYSFMKEASAKFRGWIDQLLSSAWQACQNSDVLIESPSAMAGIHIAEALQIPYFRAFTMPWTRTRAYPHAFAVPNHKKGGAYNYFTYVMFDNVFWKAIAGQVNRWRKKELALSRTSLDKLQPNKVPFLYNFSPVVVPPPLDYSDWIRVTGYWFLDEGRAWAPSEPLMAFIRRARADRKRIVYVGFGSIVVSDPAALTRTVIESVRKADVRCILSKGWSDRLGNRDATEPEVTLPDDIFPIKSAPHDWLFARIDAAVHHGGAGTTGASLRAGLPTIIKPFFGDQFFFGSRVEDLGVGICIKRLNVTAFSRALREVAHSERMIITAKRLGERIRQEDGVGNAIQAIYRDLDYARSLIKKRGVDAEGGEGDDDTEESWTFIGEDGDPEPVRRIVERDSARVTGSRGSPRASSSETPGAPIPSHTTLNTP